MYNIDVMGDVMFKKLAKQDVADAYAGLGMCYRNGIGTPIDFANVEALRCNLRLRFEFVGFFVPFLQKRPVAVPIPADDMQSLPRHLFDIAVHVPSNHSLGFLNPAAVRWQFYNRLMQIWTP